MADEKLCDILGESSNVYHTEIEKLSCAYGVLSKKCGVHDDQGMKGIKDCTDAGIATDDQFSHLFGNVCFEVDNGKGQRRKRCEDTIYYLKVTLEDLYKGKKVKLNYEKRVICKACDGLGGKLGAVIRCFACQGEGIKVSDGPLEPCMVQHMRSACSDCSGEGEVLNEHDRCKICKGKKIVHVTKRIKVRIDRGMHNGQKLYFARRGNQQPGFEPGDFVVVLQQLDHEKFHRTGADLHMHYTLTLTEALCGFHMLIKQLDGRDLLVYTVLGKVIKPGSLKRIIFEGMPVYGKRCERGDLFIKFHVTFPENHFADAERIMALEHLLHRKPAFEMPTGITVEKVDLYDYDSETEKGSGRRFRFGDRCHSAGLQCAQQ